MCKTPVEVVKDGAGLRCGQCKRVYPVPRRHPDHAARGSDRRGLSWAAWTGCSSASWPPSRPPAPSPSSPRRASGSPWPSSCSSCAWRRGRARLERSPLDGPILAFCVWTLLSAAFSPDPLTSHENAKKLVLFALFYLSVEALTPGAATASGSSTPRSWAGSPCPRACSLEYYFLGFDTLVNRPHSFLGHYMTASGLVMAVLVVAAARLAFPGRPASPALARRPARCWRCSSAALAVVTALPVLRPVRGRGRAPVRGRRWPRRGAWMALSRGPWPGPATGTTLALLVVPVASLGRRHLAHAQRVAGHARGPGPDRRPARRRSSCGDWRRRWPPSWSCGPAPVVGRLTVVDASSVDRYYMWQAGIDMIRDKPVFGQGPGRILAVYPEYRWPRGAERAAAAPPRQRPADRRRARPALPRLVALVRGRGHGRRLARGARRGAARPGRRRPRWPSWPRSWWPDCSNTISATPRSSCSCCSCPPCPTPCDGSARARPRRHDASPPRAPARCSRRMRGRPRARAGRRDARRVHLGPGRAHLAGGARPRGRDRVARRFHLGGAGNVAGNVRALGRPGGAGRASSGTTPPASACARRWPRPASKPR